jgi:hypothetical protein
MRSLQEGTSPAPGYEAVAAGGFCSPGALLVLFWAILIASPFRG